MKQSLQLKIGQSLAMTPQLQQAIRLLQLSTLELQGEIQEALETNPLLELEAELPNTNENRDNDKEAQDAETAQVDSSQKELEPDRETMPEEVPVDANWDDIFPDMPATKQSAPADDGFDQLTLQASATTLKDHLLWQLNMSNLSDRDKYIAESIIDAVAPSGILGVPMQDIFDGLCEQLENLERDEVGAVLRHVQQYDPPGVCAKDISDCIQLQLEQLYSDHPLFDQAMALAENHLDLLGGRDFRQIMRRMRIRENTLQEIIKLIQLTDPSPGLGIGDDSTEYITPDVFVARSGSGWQVSLNPESTPKLRVNDTYASLVKRADNSTDNVFIKDNLQEAKWFIKSLQSRNETLLKVSKAIVEKQQGFFNFGPEAMRPMVLHDIAEAVEMHESTISRVTTQKYMHTPRGIFELKYFFSSHLATDSGGGCSSTAIRALIKKLVEAENTKKPLSDSKMVALLADQGIQVARRTVAKYRESMAIPPSNERKQLF